MGWVGYADESIVGATGERSRSRGLVEVSTPSASPRNSGAYIFASAALPTADCADARRAIASLTGRGRRFHWRDASVTDRHKAVGVVADLPALHLVVVGVRLDPRRQERARRRCLQRLLFELDAAGVAQVWLESRTATLNARDMQAVNVFTIQGVIGQHRPVVAHTKPQDEPLLWVPDIVAGAINAGIRGDHSFRKHLDSLISRYDIDLD